MVEWSNCAKYTNIGTQVVTSMVNQLTRGLKTPSGKEKNSNNASAHSMVIVILINFWLQANSLVPNLC